MDRLAKFKPDQENLLAILHDIQNDSIQNWITEDDMKEVSEYLNMPLGSVFGVVTYYSIFSAVPRGRYVIRVCDSPVCNMLGSEPILAALKSRLGVDVGETTADGRFSLEITECLGRCGAGPSMMVNEDIHGGVTPDTLELILESYK